MGLDLKSFWDQVKENSAKLRSCPRHLFIGQPVQIGKKVTCQNCGGTMSLADVGWYTAGYKAAGGAAGDIWPGFSAEAA